MTARCGAKGHSGKPCEQPAGFGTPHPGVGRCKFHLGSTPTLVVASQRVLAAQALERMGMPVETHPDQALLSLVYEAAGNVAFLREQAGAMGADVTLLSSEMAGKHIIVREDVKAMVKLYGEWSDRLAKYAKAAIDAGIAKRYVELAESQAAAIVRVINAVLDGLALSAEQRDEGVAIARRELVLIDKAA